MLIMSGSPIVFGGAKPVPVDPRFFTNPKKDMMLVSIAGPATNIALAIICYLVFMMISSANVSAGAFGSPIVLIGYWLVYGMLINVVLAVFNMIPVPPLDGGRVAIGLLPHRLAYKLSKLEPYGLLIVIGLLIIGAFDLILAPFLLLVGKLLGV
jgi:Zn-dependent protease